jgi:hypothetical protein
MWRNMQCFNEKGPKRLRIISSGKTVQFCTIKIQHIEVTNWLRIVLLWLVPNFSNQAIAYDSGVKNKILNKVKKMASFIDQLRV